MRVSFDCRFARRWRGNRETWQYPVPVSRGLKGILDYVTNREKTVDRLISGVNCVASSALDEFESVKKQFHKTDGRAYYHIIQAFSPDDPLDFNTAHEIGIKFAEHFSGFQCVVVTHMNTAHIHNHIVSAPIRGRVNPLSKQQA